MGTIRLITSVKDLHKLFISIQNAGLTENVQKSKIYKGKKYFTRGISELDPFFTPIYWDEKLEQQLYNILRQQFMVQQMQQKKK